MISNYQNTMPHSNQRPPFTETCCQPPKLSGKVGIIGACRSPGCLCKFDRRVTINAAQRYVQRVQARLGLPPPPRVSLEAGRPAIDMQRPDREFVYFAQIRDQLPPVDEMFGNALAPVGIALSMRLRLADFAQPENAHLLVAGTTGSGKSEWLRAAVAGLLLTNTPNALRFAAADPKRNAFRLLRDSPFLYGDMAYEEDETLALLERLVEEMESRYGRMAAAGADTLRDLIRRDNQCRPRVFFICDEYGFLMAGEMKTRKEMERLVKKLGNKARAAGIHMILATQQPSRQVITGPIQTNINARVGLRLQSPYLPEEELAAVFGARQIPEAIGDTN